MGATFIAVVGMTGAGKSAVSDILVERDYQYIRFGQLTIDEVKKRGLELKEENERAVRNDLRSIHGKGAFALLNIPKFDALLEKGNVVGDGLYSWDEYKILKERYGSKLIVVAIHAAPKIRYERLEKRTLLSTDIAMRNRPATKEQAKSRDFSEIEISEKGGPIAMADYHIVNEGSVDELQIQLNKFLHWLDEEK